MKYQKQYGIFVLTFWFSMFVTATEYTAGTWRLSIDDNSGVVSVYKNSVLLLNSSQCALKVDGIQYYQSDFTNRVQEQQALDDEFGTGRMVRIVSEKNQLKLTQTYRIYQGKDFLLTSFCVESDDIISSNYMAPVYTTATSAFLPEQGNRSLFVPFDNDKWVRYKSNEFGSITTSYEVGLVYNTVSNAGLVLGSIDHTVWKTGVILGTNTSNGLTSVEVYGGVTSSETRDNIAHGSVRGKKLVSPLILVGYFTDWRDGMETYADANAVVAPKLPWSGGRPFAWNSWGALQTNISYTTACEVSEFFAENLQNNGFQNDSTVYICLDSYWDNITYSNLINFVKLCKKRGQKAGIYWTPFVDWGKNPNKLVEGTDDYYYRDIYLYANGQPQEIAGAYAVDPTHPATKARINLYLNRFLTQGFEFLKLDFMTHGSLESDSHYDSNVQTGIQAYNQGLQYIVDYLNGKMYLNLSIAPLFPANYAHGRRIACDAYASVANSEYTLNSLTYGWWLDHVYSYNDADNIVINGVTIGANRVRMTSSAITGMVCSGDDFSSTGPQTSKTRATTILTNSEINRMARQCKSFRPVVSGDGDASSDMFMTTVSDTVYLALFNFGTSIKTFTIDFVQLGLQSGTHYVVRELWFDDWSEHFESWTMNVARQDVRVLKIYPGVLDALEYPLLDSFHVFPNPCSDVLNIDTSRSGRLKSLIFYLPSGVKVAEFSDVEDDIVITALPKGLFFLQACSYSGQKYQALIMKQ